MGIFQQFPYSNFHEFNLDEIIKIMRQMQDEWENTKSEWASYKEFIDNYFENLDVSEEVLDAMRLFATDGTLANIVNPEIALTVAAWLDAHITQPTTPAIDTSLTIAGAAADAKATGDALRRMLSLDSDDAAAIPANSDLNNYTTPGNYKVASIADATTIANIPYQTSGRLAVMNTTQSSNRIAQFYLCNSEVSFDMYYRIYTSAWSNWYKMMNINDVYGVVDDFTERDVYPYGSGNATFAFNGTTITLTVNRVLAYYQMANGALRYRMYTSPGPYTIPHNSFAIFNIDTGEIEIKTYDELYAMTNVNYITMFYNSNGKVCGTWSKYLTDQNVRELTAASDSVPDYYENHVVSKSQEINDELMGIDGGAMIFITDHHYPDNKMHSPAIAKKLCNTTGINTVFLGGDFVNRELNKVNVPYNINRVGSLYELPDVNTFRVVGNHDYNNPAASADPVIVANQLTDTELRYSMLNTFADKAVVDPNTLSYYYDDVPNKIRYYVGSVNFRSQDVQNSIIWIANEMLNTPQDYSVVVIFHTILKYENGVFSPINTAADLVNLLDAVKTNGTVSIGGNTFNFTNKNIKLICAICGDMHVDGSYVTAAGVNIIATTTDSLQESGGLVRSEGTITEQAMDTFIFDKTARKIKVIRIGAGSNREFTY